MKPGPHLSVKRSVVILSDDADRSSAIANLAREVDLEVNAVLSSAQVEEGILVPRATSLGLVDDSFDAKATRAFKERESALPLIWLQNADCHLLPADRGWMPDAILPYPCDSLVLWQVANALVRLPLFQGTSLVALQGALVTIVERCVGASAAVQKPFIRGTSTPLGEVSATLTFLGSHASGAITIAGEATAMTHLHRILFRHGGDEPEVVDAASLRDLAGELANQILGVFKRALSSDDALGVRVGLPIFRPLRDMPHAGAGMTQPTLAVPFTVNGETTSPLYLELGLTRLDTIVGVGGAPKADEGAVNDDVELF